MNTVIPRITRRISILLLISSLTVCLASCQRWFRIHIVDPSEALTPLDEWEIPRTTDDMDRDSLRRAIRQSRVYLGRLPSGYRFRYGPREVSPQDMSRTLDAFERVLDEAQTDDELADRLKREFIWFRAAGRDVFGSVLFTGYYEPLLEGGLEPTETYRYPVYRKPSDLLQINLGVFRSRLKGQRIVGRLEGRSFVPYYSRAQIDGQRKALAGKGLEIAWLKDPVDLFFLHIQGSGQIAFEDGARMQVSYAGSNGHPYKSIGRILIDEGAVPKEKMSMQAIKAYLNEHPERIQEILFANPSYVFFRVVDEGPRGSLDVPVTAGRSIATDSRLFPRGGLAYIRAKQPVSDETGRIIRWETFSRFALNQDTGGAIRGAGRVDLYCGSGPEAEMAAGHMQHNGKLYFFLWKGIEADSTHRE